jgi:hypothetical protein
MKLPALTTPRFVVLVFITGCLAFTFTLDKLRPDIRQNQVAQEQAQERAESAGPRSGFAYWAKAPAEHMSDPREIADWALSSAEKECGWKYDGPTNATQALRAACIIGVRRDADDYIAQHSH